MDIKKNAVCGTLESSDCMVTVEPADELTLEVTSSVMNQYGRQIRETVRETLARLGVEKGKITLNDKGALDCTIKARVEGAVFRSEGTSEKGIPWGGVVK